MGADTTVGGRNKCEGVNINSRRESRVVLAGNEYKYNFIYPWYSINHLGWL